MPSASLIGRVSLRSKFAAARSFVHRFMGEDASYRIDQEHAGGKRVQTVRRAKPRLDADDIHDARQIVSQHVQRHLGGDLGQRLLKKWVAPIRALIVPKGCSTVPRRWRIFSGCSSSRRCTASGLGMVAEAKVLHATSGKLRATHPQAEQALLDSFVAAAGGDAALGRRGIAVPLKARDGERYVAHILPLTSGARRKAGTSYSAVATVFVHKAVLDLPSPPEALAKEFQLTPAELRVLFAIIEVGGVPEVAEVLGISESTVKTHLHHVFGKTGTTRQADLVKFVAGYSNALLA